jgi:integrase
MPRPKEQEGSKGPRVQDIGRVEPGWDKFEKFYRRGGSSDETIRAYAEHIGSLRKMAGQPLLSLTEDDLSELDLTLLKRARVYRNVLRMFFRSNRRHDLIDSMPRQRRQTRKRGLEDVLMPDDVMKLIEAAGSFRDRALIAVLAATGGRINEILSLRLKDIKPSNGSGVQMWFGETKVKSQERHSPKIEGAFKVHLDKWLAAHPSKTNREALLFPSTARENQAVDDGTIRTLLISLRKKTGITKDTNPHAFRHARVTWGIINKEDTAILSVEIWGKPVSSMLNTYSAFSGLDMKLDDPVARELPDVPALPVPPVLSTQKQVAELTARLEAIERTPARQFVRFLETAMKDDPKLKERLLAASKKSGWLP